MSDDAIKQAIEQNAAGPKRVTGDAGSVEQHALTDQIEADRYLAAKKAVAAKGLGIKLTKIAPGGTV